VVACDTFFAPMTDFNLARHQSECAGALASGKSVILRAPTGSGKSEAVWLPFLSLRGKTLPCRLIHTLPMRALVNQLESRMRTYANGRMRVAAMHGQRPESVLFYADAIFATLDQVVTSYACAPLSLSVRQGNIPAGAVAGSFLVFDEVHTFEPHLGLQSLLVLAERAHQMGIPFVIMSATLPTNFIRRLSERFGATIVEGTRLEGKNRRQRRVVLRVSSEKLSIETILELTRNVERTLVVVNTVQRAQNLYEQLLGKIGCPVILAHSRFYDDDRRTKEKQIEAQFGKTAEGQCLLIATQVVEVGLDISCDLLVTELAPIDAIVQRAGRCARWGGQGEVVVFTGLETTRPYDRTLVEATEKALREKNLNGQELTWEIERALVDTVLEPQFSKWAEPEAAGKVLASLAEAAFTGDSAKAERAVREGLTVEVALHGSPDTLGVGALRLPRCRIHPGGFQQFVHKQQPEAWRVVVDRTAADDYRTRVEFLHVDSNSKAAPYGYYIIHPQYGSYDVERGLRLGIRGSPAQSRDELIQRKSRLEGELQIEKWQDHIEKVVKAFAEHVLPKERIAFEALSRRLGKTHEDLLSLTHLVLIFHDLGKLAQQWQRKIQAGLESVLPPGTFLAHRGGSLRDLPPHATVSASLATPCLCRVAGPDWQQTLAIPALAAIAHHHSVRADMTPQFDMSEGWFDVVADCARRLAGVDVTVNDFSRWRGGGSCGVALNFLLPDGYTSYILLSRWLRLADRIATGGGENAILNYEDWMSSS